MACYLNPPIPVIGCTAFKTRSRITEINLKKSWDSKKITPNNIIIGVIIGVILINPTLI